MNALRSADVRKFLDAVDFLYEPVNAEEFPKHLLEVAKQLIPTVVSTFDIVHPDPARCVNVSTENVEDWWQQLVVEVLPEHPVVDYVLKGGQETVLTMTDFMSMRQFRQTRLYTDIFRAVGTAHQLATLIPVPGGVGGLALDRDKAFTEDDRLIMQLLRPHIVRAYTFAQLRTRVCPPAKAFQLTAREAEVLGWMAEGKRDKEIAIILGIGWRTVQTHVSRILEKLGVETRSAAAAVLVRQRGKSVN